MTRIAVIESKPTKNKYDFSFDFDEYQLCSRQIKKVLKKDVDIDIDIDLYDWVILVGSEALKYYTKYSSVMEWTGKKIDKFLPMINPAMAEFRPEARKILTQSMKNIEDYVSGAKKDIVIDERYYKGIENESEFIEYLESIKGSEYVALDSETVGFDPRKGHVLGISLSADENYGVYVNSNCITPDAEKLLQEIFYTSIVIFHNSKFDIAWLQYHFNFLFPRIEDTMLLHYCGNENPGTHGLKQLAMEYTPFGNYESELEEWREKFCKEHGMSKNDFSWAYIPFDVMKKYAAMDAVCTFRVFNAIKRVLGNPNLERVYRDILIPSTKFLVKAEQNGVPVDFDRLKTTYEKLGHEVDDLLNEILAFEGVPADFNPNSPLQIQKLLFGTLGLTPTGIKTKTGNDSTDAQVLEKLSANHPVPGLILKYRKKYKLRNTFIGKILQESNNDGRLRTSFNLHTTRTGRLSSSGKLNMQQLPRDNPLVKGCIKAKDGYKIVDMDIKTAEVYVAAALSGDEALQGVFISGEDFHSSIAIEIFELDCAPEDVPPDLRQLAKADSFAILYGGGAATIVAQAAKAGIKVNRRTAEDSILRYFRKYSKLKAWLDENRAFLMKNGHLYSFFGRKRRLRDVFSKDSEVSSHAIRSGLNFLIQSTSSDLVLLGAVDLQAEVEKRGIDAKIFALVHDSIVAEVREDQVEEFQKLAEQCVQKDRGCSIPECPLICDFGVHDDYSIGKFDDYQSREPT